MPEKTVHPSGPAASSALPSAPRSVRTTSPTSIRSRIGVDTAGGFYPAPHRYHLYLSAGCQRSLRVSVTLDLLGLRDSVSSTLLTSAAPDALVSLRCYYEASQHQFDGPLTVPALCDRWSGHIVSNHTPDILRDLDQLGAPGSAPMRCLRPPKLAARIDEVHELIDTQIVEVARTTGGASPTGHLRDALDRLDRRLHAQPYLLGSELTAADVHLWATFVHLDDEAADTARAYGRLRAYAERLSRHPAFHHPFRL